MKVELIDHMGSDLTVVNAARVSFNKESEWLTNPPTYLDTVETAVTALSDKDAKLIKYLAKHKHWTPFSHPQLTFRIKAPIFVARQLFKHKVGLTENEVSRRYVDSYPEFFFPVFRKRAENKKQGSLDEFPDKLEECERILLITQEVAYQGYKKLLEHGVCPEQARMVLPQSMYTEWYWTGSLAAFARVCQLRLDPHAQKETQEIAAGIHLHLKEIFPVSTEALLA